MAEFSRDRGGLEPARGPQYRKALLPWEREVCETLDITTEDYFEFFDLVTQHQIEEQGRELVPDIRNDATTIAIISLVVGVLSTAASFLLMPKPRSPEQKQGKPFASEDIRGRTKYAPLAEFDSVQDLATLGSLIPLIYTLREDDHGGVRAESQLIWSRMRNLPIYQELRALLLFSAGKLGGDPEYKGFAFGNNKIRGYMAAKLAIYFSRGEKKDKNKPFVAQEDRRYDESEKNVGTTNKVFYTSIGGRELRGCFCGTVTPSQSAVFGQYSPIRNGHGWKYDFKWPGKGDGEKGDVKAIIFGTRRKHVAGYHSGRTMLTGTIENLTYRIRDVDSETAWLATYPNENTPEIGTENHFNWEGRLYKYAGMRDGSSEADDAGGVKEGMNAIEQSKQEADATLDVGELYLIGSDIYRCTGRNNSRGQQGTPYERGKTGDVYYYLKREKDPGFRKGYTSLSNIKTTNSSDVYDETHVPIQKVAIGAIATTRKVDFLEIGIKSTVYRQVGGYPNITQFSSKDLPNEYAKNNQSWQPGSITTYYGRLSLFRLEIRRNDKDDWFDWNQGMLFAVYGATPQPQYNQMYILPPTKDFYEFRFIPVCGNVWIANKYYKNRQVLYMNSRMGLHTEDDIRGGYKVKIKGRKIFISELFDMDSKFFATSERAPRQTNPNSLLNDFWYFSADTTSNVNEPEHQITWLNEYVENSDEWYADESKQYANLAYAGLVCQSSTEISTFSNFSAYFREGMLVKKLLPSSNFFGSTNNFPEIVYDLLTNRRHGVGEYVGVNSTNEERITRAAQFCKANGFYWDGVISDASNVREFIFQQAAYQLLDFEIRGGQFSLFPTIPYKSDYTIDFDAKAGDSNFQIKALFTNGNVRNFTTTFLPPEDRQLFTAELKYREEEVNGFPETRLTRVRLSDQNGGYHRDPIEVFDMTQFCTSRRHAIRFAKYALRIRQLVDHSVTFETSPDAAHALAPGDYIRLGVSMQHQEKNRDYTLRLRTGSVAPNGTLQVNKSTIISPDGIPVYYWRPGFDGVREGTLKEQDGYVTNTALHGCMFTRKITTSEARIYKIESISYTEESFVEIAASYVPITKDGKMRLLEWDNDEFVIEDQGD